MANYKSGAETSEERIKAANPTISDEELEKQIFDVPETGHIPNNAIDPWN